jgi:hypothetical protein
MALQLQRSGLARPAARQVLIKSYGYPNHIAWGDLACGCAHSSCHRDVGRQQERGRACCRPPFMAARYRHSSTPGRQVREQTANVPQ